ncbi:kelch domain-containing protein 8A-like [Patiria miniata]|uniref:Uncharacterized protein n=1 Tax=Patiria miniata TaxID=46514 RepID=A0A914AE56_PATMI|nr:kelch domain-containing protein 8A-like [Patiria miniata]XP_038062211.1 kelch domain-containing protein 8A-like [Patiria miniata]XP_038062212.1 kelch domain-containing protein 8A-like [Patiria miniata]
MATAQPGVDSGFRWETITNALVKRVFTSMITVNGQLFLIGGSDAQGKGTDDFHCYNPKNKKWARLCNIPTARAGTCVVALGSTIFVIGGVGVDAVPIDAVESFDTSNKKGQWKKDIKPLADRIQGLSAVAYNDKILVVGGMKPDTTPCEKCHVLDPDKNLWLSLPDLPTPRYAMGTFLKGDKLYLVGGRIARTICPAVEVLDIVERKWTSLQPVPTKRAFPCNVSTDGYIYCIGGLKPNPKDGFYKVVEEYDIEKDEWREIESMQYERGDFTADVVGDKVVVLGGMGHSKEPHRIGEVLDPETKTWSALPPCPTSRSSAASTMMDGKLYILGGMTPSGLTLAVDVLSVKDKSTAQNANRHAGKRR